MPRSPGRWRLSAPARSRKAIQAVTATRPYAEKAWKVLVHLARQPGHASLHPLLNERNGGQERAGHPDQRRPRSGRGVQRQYPASRAGALSAMFHTACATWPLAEKDGICCCAAGEKSSPSSATCPPRRRLPTYRRSAAWQLTNSSPGDVDQVYLAYTDFRNMVSQVPILKSCSPWRSTSIPTW